jgi:hypothetical protein
MLRIHVSWAMGRQFVATAVWNGIKMRAVSECGAESAANNLALRALYGGNTKDFREAAGSLRLSPVAKGFCTQEFEAWIDDAVPHVPQHD